MDADEKLTTLQKAYADIILGVSQEAGARVMVSDWKSAKHQHKLTVMNDECLRILLRIKQMMDCQIIKSQATLLNQQKKIDELEAQLHEAEDIVNDLRGELQEVQEELERVKNESLNEPVNAYSVQMPMTNNIYSYQPSVASDTSAQYPSQSNGCGKCSNMTVCSCGAGHGPRDCKETSLYRNGCTQRIRACVNAEVKDEKDSKFKLSADIQQDRFDSFPMKRKRAVRRRKTILPLCGKKPSLSEDGTCSEICAELSPDEDLTQTAEICDDEKYIIEVSGAVTMHEDKMDVEKVGMSSGLELNSSEAANGLSRRPVREREFKYTFQRKRKRQALSNSEVNGSLETGKMNGDEENSDWKAEEPRRSLSLDMGRDSRRLAQVARQTPSTFLISLSESKW
ncbi:hypothetical protein CASFOL_038328 [Castilleja foliolosa]|uniref:Uncharacterized protein n=1 Tax=Castilleja foliolosa TaxID=1961234 RepID=A0ABD3BL55_9LAMI